MRGCDEIRDASSRAERSSQDDRRPIAALGRLRAAASLDQSIAKSGFIEGRKTQKQSECMRGVSKAQCERVRPLPRDDSPTYPIRPRRIRTPPPATVRTHSRLCRAKGDAGAQSLSRRGSGAGPQAAFQNRAAQFFVKPLSQGLLRPAMVEREFKGADRLRHGFPFGTKISP